MADLLKWVRDRKKNIQNIAGGAGRTVEHVVDQINPADNGRTWKNPQGNTPKQQAANKPAPSAFEQLTHSGLSNVIGTSIVKPALRTGIAVNQGIANLERKAAGRPTLNAEEFTRESYTPSFNKTIDYKGTKRQIAGDILTTGMNVIAPGATKLAEQAATRVLPKTVPKIVPKIVAGSGTGAALGGPQNVGSMMSDTDVPITPKNVATASAQGAAGGALLGAGAELAAPAMRGAIKVPQITARAAAQKIADIVEPKPATPVPTVQAGHIQSPNVSGGKATVRPEEAKLTSAQQPLEIPETGEKQISVRQPQLTARSEVPSVNDTSALPSRQSDASGYIENQTRLQEAARMAENPTPLSTIKTEFKSKFIDKFAPIEDRVRQAEKNGAKITPENNITYAIDRALRTDQIASQHIRDNGLDKIIQEVPDTKAFDQYLIAKHAQDLEANGVKTGRNLDNDAKLITVLNDIYEPHAQKLTQYNHNLLDTAADYGLISKDTAAHLKQKYPNYVPMNRIFGEDELQTFKGNGSGKASVSTQTAVRSIKGSERQIESPLSSIVQKTQDVIDQGERNKAAQILASYKDLPGNPFELRELDPAETVGTKPTISFFDNGKQRRFATSPEVAAAAKNFNQEQLGLIGKILSYPTRLLRLGATGLNPAFALRNVTKDIGTAFVNSKHPWKSSIANPDVFLDALCAAFNHNSPQAAEIARAAAGGTSFDIGRDTVTKNVGRIRADKNIGTKIVYTVTHPSQLLRAAENTIGRSEELGRAMQYFGNKKAFLEEGHSAGQARTLAADAARNNTVNFARAGEYGRVLNSALPYLNAGIQGSRTFVRNAKARPVATATKLAISTFMPIAITTAWNLSDPERKKAYDNISASEKAGNIIIIPPNPKQDASGRWNAIKIPLSQEVANLGSIVRNGIEKLKDDADFDFKAMAGELVGTATSFNVNNPREVGGKFTPQGLKPVVEAMTNKNLFSGQEIVPEALKNLSPEDQVTNSTSGTAKVLGKLLGWSPLQIDNAIKTSTAGLGQNVVNVVDSALAATGKIDKNEVKGKGFIPSIVQGFSGAQGATNGSVYFRTLEDTAKQQHLAGSDLDQLHSITSKALDANGQPKALNEQDKLERYRILASSPNIAQVISDTNKATAQKNGSPVDPLYMLPADKQQKYYQLQATPYKSDDYNRIKETNGWMQDFQAERAKYFDDLNQRVGTDKTGASPNDTVPFPNFDSAIQDKMDKVSELSGSARAQFISDNPDLQDAYDKIAQYTNDKRIAQGYDPFADYPTATKEVQSAIDYYNTLPKGTGSRSNWIKAHPDLYAQMQTFYAQTAAWQLANNAGKAKYAGTELNQKALKAAYSLGQYDIAKNPDGTYGLIGSTVNPILPGATKGSASYSSSYRKSGSRKKRFTIKKTTSIKLPRTSGRKTSRLNLPKTNNKVKTPRVGVAKRVAAK